MSSGETALIDAFHDLYYDGPPGAGPIYHRTSWLGVPCLKCPRDLQTTDAFEVDRSREKFLMTFNPRGYRRRVR